MNHHARLALGALVATTGLAFTAPAALATYGSLEGTKYNDVNGNGILDAGDNPLEGYKFYLDADGDKTYDAGEQDGRHELAAASTSSTGCRPARTTSSARRRTPSSTRSTAAGSARSRPTGASTRSSSATTTCGIATWTS